MPSGIGVATGLVILAVSADTARPANTRGVVTLVGGGGGTQAIDWRVRFPVGIHRLVEALFHGTDFQHVV